MVKTTEEMQRLSFEIILHAGNARSCAMEAISLAKKYNFTKAHEKIAEAEEAFIKAHQEQTNLILAEVNGERLDISMILIHAQDHLMTAITVKDLANEMIDMYKKMKHLEEK